MGGLFVFIIYLVVVVLVVKAVLKKKKTATPPLKTLTGMPNQNTVSSQASNIAGYPKKSSVTGNSTVHASGVNRHMVSEKPVGMMMEDRQHDWLAGQLNYEKQAVRRMSAMFELKAQHHSSCEAELIRQFHADNCDANEVDRASGK